MSRDKETIYAYLIEKLVPIMSGKLSHEEQTDLDGRIWGIADVLCDENQGQNT